MTSTPDKQSSQMLNHTHLEELQNLLKEATEPNRELDFALDAFIKGKIFKFEKNKTWIWSKAAEHYALRLANRTFGQYEWLRVLHPECGKIKPITGSMDAAISFIKTLIPEFEIEISHHKDNSSYPLWQVEISAPIQGYYRRFLEQHNIPSIAILLSALMTYSRITESSV